MLQKAGLDKLSQRRQVSFDKFASKEADLDLFKKWFPTYRDTGNRRHQNFKEYHARTDKLYYLPLFVMWPVRFPEGSIVKGPGMVLQ